MSPETFAAKSITQNMREHTSSGNCAADCDDCARARYEASLVYDAADAADDGYERALDFARDYAA